MVYLFSEIAELLKAYKRKTKQGSYEWSASTLAEIVANERHCGDIRAWKTFTPNFLTHKAKKNNGERTQFRRKNHHEAIVSRTVYDAANYLRASRSYAKKARSLPVLSVVDNGILRGYVPLDKDWTGFSKDEYQKASESVMSELENIRQIEYKVGLDMRGYEVVRSQYFATMKNPAMTIADGKLGFNTSCLKKFENVEYVELLLNSVNRCIAVRPCDQNNPNAIHWGRLREGRWCALSKSCRGLAKTLFDIMDWDKDLKYRFRGDFIEKDDQKVILFQLDEPEMVKTENIVLPPKDAEFDNEAEITGRTVKQTIYILPPEWENTFGRQITSIAEVNLLEQRHYAADWDVLRPAKELAEYSALTSEDLEELLYEARTIIERWPIPDEHGTGKSTDDGTEESADAATECGTDVGAGAEENGD
ncbi:recombinase family protein [Faecalibacterium prausnitzii]|uniref:recombinase family protein n=2 Tax=Faecalibacterium prausnitzii TaxID=853 RepID=UPI002666F847|nr:recombinase family protein [Faecalibacterium prausnitzii]